MTALLAWLCSLGVSFSRLSKYLSENATLAISGSRLLLIQGRGQFCHGCTYTPAGLLKMRLGCCLILNIQQQKGYFRFRKHQLGLTNYHFQIAGSNPFGHENLLWPAYLQLLKLRPQVVLQVFKPTRNRLWRTSSGLLLGHCRRKGKVPFESGSYAADL